jgi:hypothetical protein
VSETKQDEPTYTLTFTRSELAQMVGSLDTTVRHREGQPLRMRLKALYNETAVRPQYASSIDLGPVHNEDGSPSEQTLAVLRG